MSSKSSRFQRKVVFKFDIVDDRHKSKAMRAISAVRRSCRLWWFVIASRGAERTESSCTSKVQYLDRVIYAGREKVRRSNPAWMNWTNEKLKEKEKEEMKNGVFGNGRVRGGQWKTAEKSERQKPQPAAKPSESRSAATKSDDISIDYNFVTAEEDEKRAK